MTATLSADPPRPLVRIRRAPALEPPTDDERRPDDHPVCAGQLALFISVHGTADRQRGGARDNAGGRDHAGGRGPAAARDRAAATPSPSAPAHLAVSRFVSACVEVLNGFRPIAHLRPLTAPEELTAITTQLTRRAMRLRMPRRDRMPGPDGTGRDRMPGREPAGHHPVGRHPAGRGRLRVHRLRVSEQRTGVAEAVAVLGTGEASWAMALRFECRRGSWLCTLVEVV